MKMRSVLRLFTTKSDGWREILQSFDRRSAAAEGKD
jgi:hypothetical protein